MSRRLTAALIWGLMVPVLAFAAPAAALCPADAAPAATCCQATAPVEGHCAMQRAAEPTVSCCCAPAEAPDAPPATPANAGSQHETLSPPTASLEVLPIVDRAPGLAPAGDDLPGDDAAPAVFLLDCAFLI